MRDKIDLMSIENSSKEETSDMAINLMRFDN